MCNVGAALRLIPTARPQVWDVCWKNQKLGSTVPFPSQHQADSTLWLLATGPSVKNQDLSLLKEMNVMGVNGAPAILDEYGISAKYFVSTDPDFFENRMNLVRIAIESGAHCFFSCNGIARICQQAPDLIGKGKISLLETVNRFYGVSQMTPKELFAEASKDDDIVLPDALTHKVGWSHNPTKGVFASNTVTYSACQLASWMGYKTVNILGMDLGADSSGVVRAYEQGDQARPSKLEESYHASILPAFELMASLSLKTQFYNLSPHSRLPESVIPKVSFQSAIEQV